MTTEEEEEEERGPTGGGWRIEVLSAGPWGGGGDGWGMNAKGVCREFDALQMGLGSGSRKGWGLGAGL